MKRLKPDSARSLFDAAPAKEKASKGPNWSASDPFAHLPKRPMKIEHVVDELLICGSCGRDTKVVLFYVQVEGAELDMCQFCLRQQVISSASRDTLVRVTGIRMPGRKLELHPPCGSLSTGLTGKPVKKRNA